MVGRDERFMAEALAEAALAGEQGEVPVGAVIVAGERILARGRNRRREHADPTAHAEIEAIRGASQILGDWRLTGTTLYVTLEPCPMCAGALVLARVDRLVFGAADPKAGAVGSLMNLAQDPRLNHRLEISGGVLADQCGNILRDFFEGLRRIRREDPE